MKEFFCSDTEIKGKFRHEVEAKSRSVVPATPENSDYNFEEFFQASVSNTKKKSREL